MLFYLSCSIPYDVLTEKMEILLFLWGMYLSNDMKMHDVHVECSIDQKIKFEKIIKHSPYMASSFNDQINIWQKVCLAFVYALAE